MINASRISVRDIHEEAMHQDVGPSLLPALNAHVRAGVYMISIRPESPLERLKTRKILLIDEHFPVHNG